MRQSNATQSENLHIELTGGDIAAIVFFTIWALVIASSTIYDYVMVRKEKRSIKWLTTFSLYSNIKRTFRRTRGRDDNVNCLYAIRTLSILWLIVSNRFDVVSKYAIENEHDYKNWLKNVFSAFVVASDVAYDSLYIVSGFLLATYCFRAFTRKHLHYLSILFHRYIRYIPLLILSYIYHLTLMKHFVNGPLTPQLLKRIKNCENYGFTTMLIIENFMGAERMCLFHGWYFSTDFQYFIIVPIFVYFCHKSRKVGFTVLITFVCFIYSAELGMIIDSGRPYDVFDRTSLFQVESHFRCAPWFLSIILASYCLKKEVKVQKRYRIICSMTSAFIILMHIIFTYTLQNGNKTGNKVIASGLYAALNHIFWSLSICWIIFYCYKLEPDDIFERILISSIWKPLAKLTLSILIVYPIYQNSTIYKRNNSYNFDSWKVFHEGLGDILVTVFFALFLNAGVEMPFVIMKQLVYEKMTTKKIKEEKKLGIKVEEQAPI